MRFSSASEYLNLKILRIGTTIWRNLALYIYSRRTYEGLFTVQLCTFIDEACLRRPRWSRGSVLAFGTQVRGFKPGRNRRIFQSEKILSTPSFGGEVKPSVPCRRFTACKRFLNATWKSGISGKIHLRRKAC